MLVSESDNEDEEGSLYSGDTSDAYASEEAVLRVCRGRQWTEVVGKVFSELMDELWCWT